MQRRGSKRLLEEYEQSERDSKVEQVWEERKEIRLIEQKVVKCM